MGNKQPVERTYSIEEIENFMDYKGIVKMGVAIQMLDKIYASKRFRIAPAKTSSKRRR